LLNLEPDLMQFEPCVLCSVQAKGDLIQLSPSGSIIFALESVEYRETNKE